MGMARDHRLIRHGPWTRTESEAGLRGHGITRGPKAAHQRPRAEVLDGELIAGARGADSVRRRQTSPRRRTLPLTPYRSASSLQRSEPSGYDRANPSRGARVPCVTGASTSEVTHRLGRPSWGGGLDVTARTAARVPSGGRRPGGQGARPAATERGGSRCERSKRNAVDQLQAAVESGPCPQRGAFAVGSPPQPTDPLIRTRLPRWR